MSMFCGSCGTAHDGSARFCTTCGSPFGAPPPPVGPTPTGPTPTGPTPTGPTPFGTAAPGSSRRTGLLVGGAVAAVAVVVGGVLGGMALMDRGDSEADDAESNDPRQVVASAVTAEPTEAWSWSWSYEGYTEVVAEGDIVLAATPDDSGDQRITRLSSDGDVMWETSAALGVSHIDDSRDLVYAWTEWEDSGFVVLDADTGEEVWGTPDWSIHTVFADGTSFGSQWDADLEQSRYAAFDQRGEELWSTTTNALYLDDDQVFSASDGTIARLDPADGEAQWEAPLDLELEEDYLTPDVAVNEGIVVVSGSWEAVGLDPDTGEELWRRDDLYDFSSGTAFGRTMIAMTRSGDEENWEDGEVLFFNRDGEVRSKQLDPDEYSFYGDTFIQDGTPYIDVQDAGIIYDEELNPVASYDGIITPAGDGYYQLLNGELSYHLLEGGEQWSRQVSDRDDGATVVAVPGQVLIVDGPTITAYE